MFSENLWLQLEPHLPSYPSQSALSSVPTSSFVTAVFHLWRHVTGGLNVRVTLNLPRVIHRQWQILEMLRGWQRLNSWPCVARTSPGEQHAQEIFNFGVCAKVQDHCIENLTRGST